MMLKDKFSYMIAIAITTSYLIFSYMYYDMYFLLPKKKVLKLFVKKEKNIIEIMVFVLLANIMFLYIGLSFLEMEILIISIISFLEGSSNMMKKLSLLLIVVSVIGTMTKITQML